MIRKLIKHITHPALKFFTEKYFNNTRNYTYNEITVEVIPSVFPPHYTLSTKILLDYISNLDLENKMFLELGCGSGIISLLAASKGAIVTASDINKNALNTLINSAKSNNLVVKTKYSDLFDELSINPFDVIIINPPYYPKQPKSVKEKAWFCGENFEFFKKLFQQLSQRTDKDIFMILSEDCNINKIGKIASNHSLSLTKIFEKKVLGERNSIFKLLLS